MTQKRAVTKKGQTLKVSKNKPKDFVCYHCKKKILEEQKYVIVGTYIGVKERETFSEYFYHLNCWVEYFNQSVNKKLGEIQNQIVDSLKNNPMFQALQGFLPGSVQ